jgi:hypothetical protein
MNEKQRSLLDKNGAPSGSYAWVKDRHLWTTSKGVEVFAGAIWRHGCGIFGKVYVGGEWNWSTHPRSGERELFLIESVIALDESTLSDEQVLVIPGQT